MGKEPPAKGLWAPRGCRAHPGAVGAAGGTEPEGPPSLWLGCRLCREHARSLGGLRGSQDLGNLLGGQGKSLINASCSLSPACSPVPLSSGASRCHPAGDAGARWLCSFTNLAPSSPLTLHKDCTWCTQRQRTLGDSQWQSNEKSQSVLKFGPFPKSRVPVQLAHANCRAAPLAQVSQEMINCSCSRLPSSWHSRGRGCWELSGIF